MAGETCSNELWCWLVKVAIYLLFWWRDILVQILPFDNVYCHSKMILSIISQPEWTSIPCRPDNMAKADYHLPEDHKWANWDFSENYWDMEILLILTRVPKISIEILTTVTFGEIWTTISGLPLHYPYLKPSPSYSILTFCKYSLLLLLLANLQWLRLMEDHSLETWVFLLLYELQAHY